MSTVTLKADFKLLTEATIFLRKGQEFELLAETITEGLVKTRYGNVRVPKSCYDSSGLVFI